jgi:pSer/pThr/pTyr-binding forkhead associated (FHA) protein
MVANVHRAPERSPKSRIVGFFISFDKLENGEVFEIRVGRWLLTSRTTDHGDNILIDDESVSPLHAIVRATSEGKLQVLDQLSEFGTGVTRVGSSNEDEVAGAMVNLSHGDKVRFGKRHFVVCIVPKVEKDSAADTASTTN